MIMIRSPDNVLFEGVISPYFLEIGIFSFLFLFTSPKTMFFVVDILKILV